ncbi:hypothetical protein AM587_10002497 [Phytophthora nicotianae]|uniref:Uncharacterized protein n=1 Tax=Phytophthora nicotianae TaxID=4792 RepID=A0A0W8DVA3_PHYNI|nr:hypothetical protein AM587_10002497 [Phytophthora nicotianae]
MYASVLSPPNSHLLRDAVVTGVVQCTRRSNRISYHPAGFKPEERKASRDFENNEEGSGSQVPIPVSKISLNNKRKIDTTGITRFKRLKTASHEEKQRDESGHFECGWLFRAEYLLLNYLLLAQASL